MKFDQPITRRESIRTLLKWSGCITLAGAARWSLFELPEVRATDPAFVDALLVAFGSIEPLSPPVDQLVEPEFLVEVEAVVAID